MKIITDSYSIKNKKLNKKILVISDIHYYSKKDTIRLNSLINYLENYKCDYICIPGDLINEAIIFNDEILIDFITKLSLISPVIISFGNHDTIKLQKHRVYFKNEELFNKIKKIKNVHLLDNTVYEVDGIRFIGLTLPNDYYSYHENRNYFTRYLNNNFDAPPKNLYNIVLCHSPKCVVEDVNGISLFDTVNLVISGHMHAGLTPRILKKVLKGKGIVDQNHKFFPNKCYGHYEIGNRHIVISSGILKFSHKTIFKIFNFMYKAELCEINLEKK